MIGKMGIRWPMLVPENIMSVESTLEKARLALCHAFCPSFVVSSADEVIFGYFVRYPVIILAKLQEIRQFGLRYQQIAVLGTAV